MKTSVATGLALGTAALLGACLNFDDAGGAREDFCAERPDVCGTPGTPSQPDASTADTDGGSDGGTSGADAGADAGMDAGTDGGIIDGGPVHDVRFDPNRVYALGALAGTSNHVMADILAPGQVYVRAPDIAYRFTIRPTDGKLFYVSYGRKAMEWGPDRFDFIEQFYEYRLPINAHLNEREVPNACPPEDGLRDLHARPDTGELLFECRLGGLYDTQGRQLLPEGYDLLVMGQRDFKLAFTSASTSGELVLLDANNQVVRLNGESFGERGLLDVVAQRSTPDGFHVVLYEPADPIVYFLWEIKATGEVTRKGAYAPFPEGHRASSGFSALTPDGTWWVHGRTNDASHDVIARLPLQPEPATLVYSETNAPAGDWRRDLANTYLHPTDIFFTGR